MDNDNIIIDTVKMAEDGSGDIIVRLYESKKAAVSTKLHAAFGDSFKAYACDMLENVQEELPVADGAVDLSFRAFEIKTIRLK
jgi:alpha-mannosidase